jgi:uncharacterized protein YbbC (DUF1343 family)
MIRADFQRSRTILFYALFLALAFPWMGNALALELGIDVLQKNGFDLLRGKRVGLVTNQTGVNSSGEKTRLILRKHCNLVALYTPEHGLDGTEKAGVEIKSRRDSLTGLKAWSLYGDTRKPTPEMLAGIDVLVIDIQDIGCRSYTYISTMGKCLQACAEQGKELVILDRPNPLGGNRVEGMGIDPKWISFVGQFPIPYVHGLTMGELALMANAKGWMGAKAKIEVVKMRGWTRSMTWPMTGLKWVPTSPNIPLAMSPNYYVITGLVGGLAGGLDLGLFSPRAFQVLGAPWIRPQMASYLRSKCPEIGVDPFTTPSGPGVIYHASPEGRGNLCAAAIHTLAESNRLSRGAVFNKASATMMNLFYKVYGSDSVRRDLATKSPEQIIASWRPFLARFQAERQPFLLYE